MRLAQDEDIWDGIVRAYGAGEGVDVKEEAAGRGVEGGADLRGVGLEKEKEKEQDRRREEWTRSVKWVWSVRGIVEGLWGQVKAEKAKNLWWSRRLKEVVEREKALAGEEQREWMRNRRKEKRMAQCLAKGLEAHVQEEERRFYVEQEQKEFD